MFPVEERPVPPSPIPGEESWPTQPHPVKPPPVARQSITRADITNVTPESRAECLEMIEDAIVEGEVFRPIQEKLTVMFPGTNGGPNWGGGSFDPENHTLYVNSMDVGAFMQMIETGGDPEWRQRGTKWGRFWDSNQYPCQKPPWGHLTAVDLNSGEFRWRVVLGEYDELTAKGVAKTGAANLGGSVVTKGGLVFIAATNDKRFRAFDKDSGEQLWEYRMPGSGHATPMTFMGKDGRQYVAIASGGGNKYNDNYLATLWSSPCRRAAERMRARSESNGRILGYGLPRCGLAATFRPELRAPPYQSPPENLPRAVGPQPVAFSHKTHAENNIKCVDCHKGAEKKWTAGLPTLEDCMLCHQTIATDHPEVQKLTQLVSHNS